MAIDPLHQAGDLSTEIIEEQTVILRREQVENASVVLPQVTEEVEKHRVLCPSAGTGHLTQSGVRDVAEQVGAEVTEQVLLGLEMGVEGGAAHVGGVEDVLHRNLVIVFLGK